MTSRFRSSRGRSAEQVPVIALTGFLGAGKTTVLNHLLRQPGARVGVIVNDFGAINVDAGLVRGQVDEPASIAGGCVCCLPDAGGLDEALEKLTHPRLGLDAVLIEASGIAEPVALARLIQASEVDRVRLGGVVDVVDALEFFDTVGTDGMAPARFAVASLVVINKCDQVTEPVLARIEERVRQSNPAAHIVRVRHGRVDPTLIYDAGADRGWLEPELPFDEPDDHHENHAHAQAVSVSGPGPIAPSRLLDLLESPPPGTYRLKGTVVVAEGARRRGFIVNLVGRSLHVRGTPAVDRCELVAVGLNLDASAVQRALDQVIEPATESDPTGLNRLDRYRRLSE